MTATAKLFWTGNSQAVRLPKEFRFEGKEVRIFKQGNQVIIEPIVDDWDWVNDLEPFDDTMEHAILELKNDVPQERDWSVFE
ncbi:antitoxin [Alysiella crassa]|uniref:Antitoxin VapB1 n=1 Tax=Alysiella crassa TaxID=153491 RepID=A0A376BN38_9NEIS|nr:type II toxin-antitoxin system VapB family antitoxin [Alysiella crassa]UOP06839.1 type II toxin-antitoxin system VapB family antitoxin [Alysiella crassa]SSY71035.1 Antitoxin VapB1 [Alysiella crassa]